MQYQPIAQIGRGGMAEVTLAMMEAGEGVRRLAVLKRIWPELATDPEFVAMFLDEARLSLRLSHPNVVQTYEVLVGDDELAIAMEYLDGQPLTRILNRLRGPGDLGLPLRLRILTNVLAGLEHAHTLTELDGTPLGVVHRDVSPQNVFVTYDGHVKLVDFGVAKTLSASYQTRPGAIKGKLAYMAPEQLQRGEVDRRSDLFAVGVMLWEMLAGRRMWHGMTEVDICGHLAAARPMPPLPADAGVPSGLDAICARALDPDPARRYQTATDFELELEGILIGAADSHARHLGKVVSLAFEAERGERQALIERSLAGTAEAAPSSADAVTPPPTDAPMTPETSEASPLADGDSLSTVHVFLEHGAEATAASVAPVADWPLSDSTDAPDDLLPAAAVPVADSRVRGLWVRRVAALAGVGVALAALAMAGGGYRPLAVESGASPEAAAVPSAPEPAPMVTPTAPRDRRGTGATVRGLASAEPSVAEPRRPRRRHRPPPVDADATLPPNVDLTP